MDTSSGALGEAEPTHSAGAALGLDRATQSVSMRLPMSWGRE